jgi:hypothetical protein
LGQIILGLCDRVVNLRLTKWLLRAVALWEYLGDPMFCDIPGWRACDIL